MATMVASSEPDGISIGRVIQRAINAVSRHLAVAIALGLLFGAGSSFATSFLLSGVSPNALVMTVAGYAVPGAIALFLLRWFIGQVTGTLLQGAMIPPLLAEAEGRRASAYQCFSALGRSLLSLAALGAIIGLGLEIGITLLIVPAVIIYILWSVAPSALVAEGEGVFMALNRSQELTEGARWKILGLLSMLEAINFVVGFGTAFAARQLLGISISQPALTFEYIVPMGVLATVVQLMWAAVQASLYVELVQWKYGGSAEMLADVFA